MTVTAAVPLLPSLVAVIVTGPPATLPVTRPLASTVATVASPVVQTTVRPVSVMPLASFNVAVSCRVAATCTLPVAGVTRTVSTGTRATVIAALPLFPSLVAVIVADPSAFAVTSPVTETLAIPVSLLAQVTARPLRGLPAGSLGVAVSWMVCPGVRLAVAGLTSTDATDNLVWQLAEPASVKAPPVTCTNSHE